MGKKTNDSFASGFDTLEFVFFAPNLAISGGLFDLIQLMGFIGYNCSEFSHSSLSDICTSLAVILLIECELFTLQLFSTNYDLLTLRGICDANGEFKCGLIVEFESVNCDTNGSFF